MLIFLKSNIPKVKLDIRNYYVYSNLKHKYQNLIKYSVKLKTKNYERRI